MFSDMVSSLKKGEVADLNILRKRFDTALVKKIAVISTPYSFWTSDPKINPPTKELIWAAILLQDSDNYKLLTGIVATETNEKNRASGQNAESSGNISESKKITGSIIEEFLTLAPTENFRKLLKRKLDNTLI